MGVISRFKKRYINDVDKYIKKNKDRNTKYLKQRNDSKGYETYETKLVVKLPTIVGFSIYLGFAEKTLYTWAGKSPEFRLALDRIKNEQKQRLMNSGLSGQYNSTIAKLILSSNHGMKERVDNTTDDEPINSFNDEQIDRIADRIARRKRNDGGTSSTKKSN